MSTPTKTNQIYTILEAAKLSGLPESTLRYYETIGLIDPIRRGRTSKQREYTDDDINMVIAVACLSATGMSIDNMREYLGNRSRGADAAGEQINLLDKQRTRLLEEAHFMQLRQRYVDVKIDYWKAVEAGDSNKVAEMRQLADSIASELKLPRLDKDRT
jgi:DNA-binding transcriptional MerR regulator